MNGTFLRRSLLMPTSSPPTAEIVHAWIARQLPDRPHPPIKRPINWMRWASTITILAGAGTLLVTASPYVLPILQNRNIWASISLISILLFTSGHMFNHIRKVPYVTGDGRGGISYFVAGFQSQLGLETQIIAAICKARSCVPLSCRRSRADSIILRRCHVVLRHCPCC